jgi:hypothetical protein
MCFDLSIQKETVRCYVFPFQFSQAKLTVRNRSAAPKGFTRTLYPPKLITSDQKQRPFG